MPLIVDKYLQKMLNTGLIQAMKHKNWCKEFQGFVHIIQVNTICIANVFFLWNVVYPYCVKLQLYWLLKLQLACKVKLQSFKSFCSTDLDNYI